MKQTYTFFSQIPLKCLRQFMRLRSHSTYVLRFGLAVCLVILFCMYLYDCIWSQVYPTSLRAVGVGTCSGMARFGAMLTPVVAQVLPRTSLHLATATYGIVAILAIAAALMLPIETRGRAMT